jgi:hypothetical protein
VEGNSNPQKVLCDGHQTKIAFEAQGTGFLGVSLGARPLYVGNAGEQGPNRLKQAQTAASGCRGACFEAINLAADRLLSQLQQVVGRADDRPFGAHLRDAAHQELTEATRLLDLPKHRRTSCSPLQATSASPIPNCLSPWRRSVRRIERTLPRPSARCSTKWRISCATRRASSWI